MGKWKSKIVSSARGKVENAWELAVSTDPDGYGPSVLVAVPVGAGEPAFAFPLGAGIDMMGLLFAGFFKNAKFPPPSQVLVSAPEMVSELRKIFESEGITVLLQKRLPTIARIEEQVLASVQPPDAPGVDEDLDEWRSFALAQRQVLGGIVVDRLSGYLVEGGELDGACVHFSMDGASTLFRSEAEFEHVMDRGAPSDATVASFFPLLDLSEEEQQNCEDAGLVFDPAHALVVEHVVGGFPMRISAEKGRAHRGVVGALLPFVAAGPDADGNVAAPENAWGITGFRRVFPSERARRVRLPTDASCYPVPDLAKLVTTGTGSGPAIVVEAFMDETDDCAALLDRVDRIVVEECVGCSEQRVLAFAGDSFVVEAGRIDPAESVPLERPFPDGQLSLALVEIEEDISHLADELAEIDAEYGDDEDEEDTEPTFTLVREWSLPYEIAWVDHEGNPVEKHAPKPVRSQSVRGRARTSSRGRN